MQNGRVFKFLQAHGTVRLDGLQRKGTLLTVIAVNRLRV